MPIRAKCQCGKAYLFKDAFAGRRAKCPACGQVVQIPGQQAEPSVRFEQVRSFGDGDVDCLAVCWNRMLAVSGGYDKLLRLWDLSTGKILRKFEGHSNPVESVAISSDANLVVSSSGGADALKEMPVRLWDCKTGKCLGSLPGHTRAVGSVAISPDDRLLVTGDCDGRALVRSLPNGKVLGKPLVHSGPVSHLAFSPDGQLAVGVANPVRLWDVPARKCLQSFVHPNATCAAFLPDARSIAISGFERDIGIWDCASGKRTQTLTGHKDWVRGIAVSANGLFVVSGSRDKTLRVWDMRRSACIHSVEFQHGISCVSMSFNGEFMVSGTWSKVDQIQLWKCCGGMVSSVPASPTSMPLQTSEIAKRPEEPWEKYRQFVSLPRGAADSARCGNMRFQFMFKSPAEASRILSSLPEHLAAKLPVPRHWVGTADYGPLVHGKQVLWYERVTLTVGEGKELMNLVVLAGGEIYEAMLD
jgi:WD40 repeat protein